MRKRFVEERQVLKDNRTVELSSEHVEARIEAKEGWAAAQGKQSVVVLSTDLTPELIREGLARDLVRYIQERRKEIGCEYTDRISVAVESESDELNAAIQENADYIKRETLAVQLANDTAEGDVLKIGEIDFRLKVEVQS